jgi:hypothetical protein
MTTQQASGTTNDRRRLIWPLAAAGLGLILVAIAVLRLVGAGGDRQEVVARPPQPTPPATTVTQPTSTVLREAEQPETDLTPVAVRIRSVGIDSPLERLGLNPDHTLEVPRDFAKAGWFVHQSVPGEPGPGIIAGHVDSTAGPAVFYRLREVERGATIEVERSDGSVAVFEVARKEQHDKDAFPTARVYGPTSSPQLRVITCGGTFDRSVGHYNDNVILFAGLERIVPG